MSRDIDYVVFSVVPTLEDDNETKNSIENIKNDFANYDDYQTIVRRNTDNTRAIFSFQNEDALNNDSAFASLISQEKGSVIGPYKINSSTYRITKLVDVQRRPDSVQARHVLILLQQSMDSVKVVVNNLKKKLNQDKILVLLLKIFQMIKHLLLKVEN